MPKIKKKTPKKKPSKRKPSKRKLQPDDKLAAIVGSQPAPRSELTKKLWSYIKRHGSQDKKKISKSKLTKFVDKHTTDSSGTDSPGPGRAW